MLDTLLTPQLGVAFVLAATAGFMRGYTGFGTPIFLSPLYAVLFGPQATVPLLILMEISVVVQMVPRAWPKADLRELSALSLGCFLFLPFGALALGILDPNLVKKVIGLMTCFFVAMLWFGWRYRGPRGAAIRFMFGGVSGFCNGLTAIGAPPVVLYYAGHRDIVSMRANLIVYFASITLIAVPSFFYFGLVTWETIWRCVILTPPHLIGVAVGTRLFHGTSEKTYIRAALVTLLVSGLVGVFG
jgi:hypothetical protein